VNEAKHSQSYNHAQLCIIALNVPLPQFDNRKIHTFAEQWTLTL